MSYDNFLIEEIIQWDTEKFNLIFKNPIIFLCGGDVKPISKPEVIIYTSLRSYLIDFSSTYIRSEIRTAEDFSDYHLYYENLLEFESDMASISDLVVVILEGEGALIELGLFSGKPDIFNKLVVIQHSDFSSEQSFISLGPLRALRAIDVNSVLDYNWPFKKDFTKLNDEVLKLICQDISLHLKSERTQSKFDINIDAHLILFIYEVIRCFFPITEKEILDVLQLLYVSREFTLKKVKKITYLLSRFDLVGKRTISSTTYIYPLDQDFTKVKLAYKLTDKKKLIFDFLKLRVGIVPHIRSDTRRALALQEIKENS
ncbi:retron St85 family effector protein [Acinetobacter pittii]|uniref:retron St85 family effector protein n=1 Tax=Acinetobacter pittii TaxID=48296 RepID=UPI00355B2922